MNSSDVHRAGVAQKSELSPLSEWLVPGFVALVFMGMILVIGTILFNQQ